MPLDVIGVDKVELLLRINCRTKRIQKSSRFISRLKKMVYAILILLY